MHRLAVPLVIAVTMLFAFPGCSTPAVEEVATGTEFTLSAGQSVTLRGEDVQIEFVEVVSDSRCPTGATCIWAGEVSCLIELTTSGSTYSKVLTQQGSSSPATAIFVGYEFAFDVQPYPELGKDIQQKDYHLKLVVTRAPA